MLSIVVLDFSSTVHLARLMLAAWWLVTPDACSSPRPSHR
jgi:hypothetical protein